MSDFDKEAEREKLRKKYADDEDKRANTKRMSELLLKGATMTNQHCDDCGDPLFSHNGQTFCASCQANAQQSPDAQQSAATQQQATAQQSATTQQANGTPQSATPDNSATPDDSTTASQPTDAAGSQSATDVNHQQPATPQPQSPQPQSRQATPQPSPSAAASTEGLTAARQSLVGTVTRFSQRAAEADDPRRAKELLGAAREAAETLRALEFE